MRQARVYVHGTFAGTLLEERPAGDCLFRYDEDYDGPPVSISPSSRSTGTSICWTPRIL